MRTKQLLRAVVLITKLEMGFSRERSLHKNMNALKYKHEDLHLLECNLHEAFDTLSDWETSLLQIGSSLILPIGLVILNLEALVATIPSLMKGQEKYQKPESFSSFVTFFPWLRLQPDMHVELEEAILRVRKIKVGWRLRLKILLLIGDTSRSVLLMELQKFLKRLENILYVK
jgi:hypothetical protein